MFVFVFFLSIRALCRPNVCKMQLHNNRTSIQQRVKSVTNVILFFDFRYYCCFPKARNKQQRELKKDITHFAIATTATRTDNCARNNKKNGVNADAIWLKIVQFE